MSFVNVFMGLWLITCTISDWRSRRVPNMATLGFLLIAAGSLLLHGESLTGTTLSSAGLGLLCALLLTLPGFVLNQFGGGDVKLLAGLGLATDARHVLITFVLATVLLLLVVLIQRTWHRSNQSAGTQREWPFIPFLSVGYLAAYLLCVR